MTWLQGLWLITYSVSLLSAGYYTGKLVVLRSETKRLQAKLHNLQFERRLIKEKKL